MKKLLSAALNKGQSAGVSSILTVSTTLMAARMGGVAANFFFNLLLARLLAPEDVGTVMLIVSTAMLASILTTWNIEAGSIRHLLYAREEGQAQSSAGFVLFSRRLWLLSTPLVVTAYLTAALLGGSGGTVDNLWIYAAGALAAPIIGWLRLNTRQATVLSRQLAGSIPNLLIRPLLLLALVAACVPAGIDLSRELVLVLFTLTALVAAIVQFMLLRSAFRFVRTGPHSFAGRKIWLQTGFLLTASLVITEYFQDVTLATAALVLPAADIAKLAIALRLVGFVSFGLAAVSIAVSPRITQALARNDAGELARLLTISAHVKFWSGLLVGGVLVAVAEPVLGLFGPEYVDAAPTLGWLILMPLLIAAIGPNEMLLNITGKQRYIFRSALGGLGVAMAAIPGFASLFGLQGAAAGAVLGYAVWELMNYANVRRLLKIDASIVHACKHTAQVLTRISRERQRGGD
jgi:O-antigen/teichoic acid export membrane protein